MYGNVCNGNKEKRTVNEKGCGKKSWQSKLLKHSLSIIPFVIIYLVVDFYLCQNCFGVFFLP